MAREKVFTSTSVLVGTYDIEVDTDNASRATYQDPVEGQADLMHNEDTQQWERLPFTGGE